MIDQSVLTTLNKCLGLPQTQWDVVVADNHFNRFFLQGELHSTNDKAVSR